MSRDSMTAKHRQEEDRLEMRRLFADRLSYIIYDVTGQHVTHAVKILEIVEQLMGEFDIKQREAPALSGNPVEFMRDVARQPETQERYGAAGVDHESFDRASADMEEAVAGQCPVCLGTTRVCHSCGSSQGSCCCVVPVRSYVDGKLVKIEHISGFDPVVCNECGGTGNALSQ